MDTTEETGITEEDDRFSSAVDMAALHPEKAVTMFEDIILKDDPDGDDQKIKEQSIYQLGDLYVKLGRVDSLKDLLKNVRPFLKTIPKAKTAKIVRTLIDLVGETSPDNYEQLVALCEQSIEWCKQEKRTFLRQRIESRLATLFLKLKRYKDALALINTLSAEVKKLDDKLLLVEIYLTESRIRLATKNVPVSKAALTAARAAANAIYCPPDLQAQIDSQSGIISAAEKDFKTAFSYFYESFEGFNTVNDPASAVISLKYMLLSKILTDSPGDVRAIISGKAGLKFAGREVQALQAVAESHKARSLHQFQQNLVDFKDQLVDDPIVHSHLQRVYETLFEKNLLRIIEPFSRVQILHIAKLIDMDAKVVEAKFSEMILDKKLRGILDQGVGDLILYEEVPENKTYEASLGTISELNGVVEQLMQKAQKLHV
uniref:26S proteasome non-ATPase regulatory subunit 11A-like n=1 Tax=Hirondellea gigas TaxID=1518452 RepID=A0A6A7G3P0_9CRUS